MAPRNSHFLEQLQKRQEVRTMSTETERDEMTAEVQRLLARGNHPWMLFTRALDAEDREVAELVLELGADKLSGKEKVAASAAIKRTFGETSEEWRARQDEANTAYRSEVGEALDQRNERRRAQKAKLDTGKTYGGHGWRTPPENMVQPEPGSFNTPVGLDRPERRGFNRIRGLYTRPEGDDSA